jgi:hypothetical protein
MEYDINRPWLSLDPWQEEYIFKTDPNKDCFLLTTRQGGKTTAMSIKSVELCINHFKKGDNILICSITEKQAYRVLAKALAYAQEKYPREIMGGKDKPTMHRVKFKNGTSILCYASGETGEGLRGYTIKKLLIDEGSRMKEEFFIAVTPMLSVARGSMDIASTPFGKKYKDGSEKFFYKCSKDSLFKKFYVHAKDCPRHTEEFLKREKDRMSRLQYAQEYEAKFLDDLRQIFTDDWIRKICILKRPEKFEKADYFVGCDIAGLGDDEITMEILKKYNKTKIEQVDSIVKRRQLTTETSQDILDLDKRYNFKKIGIDDGGVGFGVWSELMNSNQTRRKTEALNNASRPIDREGERSKKLLKEEMYINLLALGDHNKIKLLDDDEVKLSLQSIQHENGKIYGSYSHIAEGIVRAAWLCSQSQSLNIYLY